MIGDIKFDFDKIQTEIQSGFGVFRIVFDDTPENRKWFEDSCLTDFGVINLRPSVYKYETIKLTGMSYVDNVKQAILIYPFFNKAFYMPLTLSAKFGNSIETRYVMFNYNDDDIYLLNTDISSAGYYKELDGYSEIQRLDSVVPLARNGEFLSTFYKQRPEIIVSVFGFLKYLQSVRSD